MVAGGQLWSNGIDEHSSSRCLKRGSRSVAVYDGYGAVYIYGSEGWGFESLRARDWPKPRLVLPPEAGGPVGNGDIDAGVIATPLAVTTFATTVKVSTPSMLRP